MAVADDLLEYLQDADVVIHNASFDLGFLNKELQLLGRPPLKTCVGNVIDTLVMAKEMYPGKRNSLDSLCDQLGVDNSSRTLHGALLDAELLADVYICLTRGQEALLIAEDENEDPSGESLERIDLRGIALHVLPASDSECAAHDKLLAQLDKASGGKTVWRESA